MVSERYGGKIVNYVNAYRWMLHRGGWLLMRFNALAGMTSPFSGATQNFYFPCQAVGSFDQRVGNTYAWTNIANGIEKPVEVNRPGGSAVRPRFRSGS